MRQHRQHQVATRGLAAEDDVRGAAVPQQQAQGRGGLGQLARVGAFGREGVLEEDERGARGAGERVRVGRGLEGC